MASEARVVDHRQPLRGDADREDAALAPVIAEVCQPAHAHAAGKVQGGAPREDRERQPLRSPAGDPGEPPERAPGSGQDRRGGRIRRDRSQRPVEVAHDEQPAGRADQGADGGNRPPDGAGIGIAWTGIRIARTGSAGIGCRPSGSVVVRTVRVTADAASAGDPRAHGVTVTPGRIAWSPRAIRSAPIPPSAASRTIPWASMK